MTILAKQAEIATTNPQAIDEWLNNYLASNYGFTLEEYQQFRKLLANKFHAFKERNVDILPSLKEGALGGRLERVSMSPTYRSEA